MNVDTERTMPLHRPVSRYIVCSCGATVHEEDSERHVRENEPRDIRTLTKAIRQIAIDGYARPDPTPPAPRTPEAP